MWSGTLLHLPYKSTQVHPTSVVRHRCNLPIKRPKTCCLAHFQLSETSLSTSMCQHLSIRFSELSTGFQSKLRVSESFGESITAITAITAVCFMCRTAFAFPVLPWFPAWGLPCRPRCSTNCTTVPAIFAVLQMQPWTVSKGHSLEV